MTPEQFIKSNKLFNMLLKNYQYETDNSLRDFALEIKECISDVSKWKSGKKQLSVRAIVKICRMFDVNPHELNPDHFPPDLQFVFDKSNKSKTTRYRKNVK